MLPYQTVTELWTKRGVVEKGLEVVKAWQLICQRGRVLTVGRLPDLALNRDLCIVWCQV